MPEMTVSNRPHVSGAEAKMDGLVNMDMNNRDPMVQ